VSVCASSNFQFSAWLYCKNFLLENDICCFSMELSYHAINNMALRRIFLLCSVTMSELFYYNIVVLSYFYRDSVRYMWCLHAGERLVVCCVRACHSGHLLCCIHCVFCRCSIHVQFVYACINVRSIIERTSGLNCILCDCFRYISVLLFVLDRLYGMFARQWVWYIRLSYCAGCLHFNLYECLDIIRKIRHSSRTYAKMHCAFTHFCQNLSVFILILSLMTFFKLQTIYCFIILILLWEYFIRSILSRDVIPNVSNYAYFKTRYKIVFLNELLCEYEKCELFFLVKISLMRMTSLKGYV
jgi:hypothetical protein